MWSNESLRERYRMISPLFQCFWIRNRLDPTSGSHLIPEDETNQTGWLTLNDSLSIHKIFSSVINFWARMPLQARVLHFTSEQTSTKHAPIQCLTISLSV